MIGLGETVTWRARYFGLNWSLTSRVSEFDRPALFVDEQVSGPFAWFRHEHRFQTVPDGTLMVDDWRHTVPFGPLGVIADRLIVGPLMHLALKRRNAALRREAKR